MPIGVPKILKTALARECVRHGLVLLILLPAIFPGVFFRGEVITPADILFKSPPWNAHAPEGWTRPRNPIMTDIPTAFHPFYALSREAVARGEWPLWNRFELGGMPLLANYQSAVFYPPRILQMALDLEWGTTLFILFKVWLCGMTAFTAGKLLGLGLPAARFYSIAWMCASFNLIWCNWSLTDAAAWMPILFAGVERALERPGRQAFFLLALGGGLMLLAGHPETAFALNFGLGLYFLLRLAWERRWGKRLWRPAMICAGAAGLAAALSAAQLLPFIEYLANRTHLMPRPLEGLTMASSAAFFVPRFFGSQSDYNFWGTINSHLNSMLYPGLAVWFGVFALMFLGPRRAPERYRARAMGVAAVFGVLLAFELSTLQFLHKTPLLKDLRHSYTAFFAIFSLPLLGAMGVERWFSERRRWREAGYLVIPVALVSAGLWGGFTFYKELLTYAGMLPYMRAQFLVAAAFGALAFVILAIQAVRPLPRLLPALLTVCLAADLIIANRHMNPTLPRDHAYPETDLTRFLKSLGQPTRIGTGEGYIASGLLAAYGIEEWLGYDGLYPERVVRFQVELGKDIWKAMEPACAIAYYLHNPEARPAFAIEDETRFQKVGSFEGIEVYKNLKAFPRAYLVPRLEGVPDVNTLFARMRDPAFNPAAVALTEAPPPNSLPPAPLRRAGGAEITEWGATRVVVEVETNAPGVLVLPEAYYPGWKATVDGRAVEIFPVYYAFRGVLAPAGAYRVIFEYNPLSFQLGLGLSLSVMAATAVYFLWTRRAIRRSMRRPPV